MTRGAEHRRVTSDDLPPPALAQVDGSSRRQVGQLQRARLIRAMILVSAAHDFEGASVARVIRSAGCSRRTFYELFGDRHGCFCAALSDTVERAAHAARPGYDAERLWANKVRAGLHALLEFFAADPACAQFCFVTSLSGGSKALAYREEICFELTSIVEQGRTVAAQRVPPLTGEAVVNGVLAIVQQRVQEGRTESLPQLTGQLMAIIVQPYLGGIKAGHELRRQPAGPRRVGRPVVNLAEVRIPARLTHRTLLVLAAIAATPSLSNRLVAEAAGIADQGQISKLLGRLKRGGLIENVGAGHSRGEANAWRITEAGTELLQSAGSAGRR